MKYVWVLLPAEYDNYSLLGVYASPEGANAAAEATHKGAGHLWQPQANAEGGFDCIGRPRAGCWTSSIERHEVQP